MDSWYFANYDQVNIAYKAFLDKLNSPPPMPAQLEQEIPDIKKQLEFKFALIERLKSSNAVLRNSVNYLPEIASEIILEIEQIWGDKIISKDQALWLSRQVQDIVFKGVTKQLLGQSGMRLKVVPMAQIPVQLRASWQVMQKHLNVFLEYKQRDKDLNKQLEDDPLQHHLKALSQSYSSYLQQLEESQQWQKVWLISYFAAALGLIIALVMALRYYHRQHSLHKSASMTDSLTGLGNRRKLNEQVTMYLEKAKRKNSTVGVLFIDLDGFKQVNDTLGHKRGDKLLQQIATNMQGSLRQGDLITRIGGDEFVVLIPGASTANLKRIATNLKSLCTMTIDYSDRPLQVSASIGISYYPDDTKKSTELLEFADQAMYQAKMNGKSSVSFYIDNKRV